MWRAQTGAALVSVFLGGATIGISLPSHQQPGLFSSNDLMEFALEANWDELDDDRDQESEERPGRVLWTDPGGT